MRTHMKTLSSAMLVLTLVGCADAAESGHTMERSPASSSSETTHGSSAATPTQVSCLEEAPATPRPDDQAALYFYCVNEPAAVIYTFTSKGDRQLEELVRAYLHGPSADQVDAGYHGGLAGKPRFDLTRTATDVVIDLAPDSVSLPAVLGGAWPITRPLERTIKEFTGVRDVRLTVGGQALCDLDDECSSP